MLLNDALETDVETKTYNEYQAKQNTTFLCRNKRNIDIDKKEWT